MTASSSTDYQGWSAKTMLVTGFKTLCRAAQGVRSTFAQTFEGIRSATWGAKPKSPSAAEASTASHLQGTSTCIASESVGVRGSQIKYLPTPVPLPNV